MNAGHPAAARCSTATQSRRDGRKAVALLLDCMCPQAKTTTVDEVTEKLQQLDAEVEEEANEGHYLQVCCAEEVGRMCTPRHDQCRMFVWRLPREWHATATSVSQELHGCVSQATFYQHGEVWSSGG